MGELSGATVLLTGATGFIGSHLARQLAEAGAAVAGATSRDADITDAAAVSALVARVRPTHVFHLAAFTHVGRSWERIDDCIQVNVQGTVHLLQAVHAAGGCERFVLCSTSDVYGDGEAPFREDGPVSPISPYSVSKHAAERYGLLFHRSFGTPVVVVRPFNTYGPGQTPDRVVPEIITRALRGEDIAMTQGRQTREFNYVEDVAAGILRAGVAEGVAGEVFNIGGGDEVSMRAVATAILEEMGNPVRADFGALPDRPAEIWRMFGDPSRARDRLGWEPAHTLREGLTKTIAWYRDQAAAAG